MTKKKKTNQKDIVIPGCRQLAECFQPLLYLNFTIDLMLTFSKLLIILVSVREMSEAKDKRLQS